MVIVLEWEELNLLSFHHGATTHGTKPSSPRPPDLATFRHPGRIYPVLNNQVLRKHPSSNSYSTHYLDRTHLVQGVWTISQQRLLPARWICKIHVEGKTPPLPMQNYIYWSAFFRRGHSSRGPASVCQTLYLRQIRLAEYNRKSQNDSGSDKREGFFFFLTH
jgi:hypothetical protein